MKNALVCLCVISATATATAATPMARVIGVRDSHSIVVATGGAMYLVELKNVTIAPEEEADAMAYLRQAVANTWVFVDHGDVYRSADALYVNGDMNRHPWRTMKILGQLDLGPRPKGQPAAGMKVTPPPTLPAPQSLRPESRGTRAPRAGSRRSGRLR